MDGGGDDDDGGVIGSGSVPDDPCQDAQANFRGDTRTDLTVPTALE